MYMLDLNVNTVTEGCAHIHWYVVDTTTHITPHTPPPHITPHTPPPHITPHTHPHTSLHTPHPHTSLHTPHPHITPHPPTHTSLHTPHPHITPPLIPTHHSTLTPTHHSTPPKSSSPCVFSKFSQNSSTVRVKDLQNGGEGTVVSHCISSHNLLSCATESLALCCAVCNTIRPQSI